MENSCEDGFDWWASPKITFDEIFHTSPDAFPIVITWPSDDISTNDQTIIEDNHLDNVIGIREYVFSDEQEEDGGPFTVTVTFGSPIECEI